jgi:sulfur carrier protein
MELTVNGVRQQVADGSPVTQLLATLQVVPERVVVEVNLKILKRAEHATTILKEGDQVEIVRFVGGGCDRSNQKPVTRDGKEPRHC